MDTPDDLEAKFRSIAKMFYNANSPDYDSLVWRGASSLSYHQRELNVLDSKATLSTEMICFLLCEERRKHYTFEREIKKRDKEYEAAAKRQWIDLN